MPDSATLSRLLEIRRYPNRRLYDVTRSKTVTLDELHGLVVEGRQIRVTETATGEDITGRVLTQMILDLDIAKLEMFPVGLLHAVLQANESLVREFMDTHFHQALELFSRSREQFEAQWQPAVNPAVGANWMQAWMAPFMGAEAASSQRRPEDEALVDVVKDLSRQVAELQQEMVRQRAARDDA
mgnify:CR=1 FL=1